MKTLMNQLVFDYRKLKDEELEDVGYRVHFFKYLKVFPKDKVMASHVVSLFDNMNSVLISKSVVPEFKLKVAQTVISLLS